MKDYSKNIEALWKAHRERNDETVMGALGIEFTEMSEKVIKARMPVDRRTRQYFGVLHGGASVVLAESLASMGAYIFVDMEKQYVAGLEINANHLRPVSDGFVFGEGRPLHLGKTSQVWQIEIKNAEGKLVCVSRCTIAVVSKKS